MLTAKDFAGRPAVFIQELDPDDGGVPLPNRWSMLGMP